MITVVTIERCGGLRFHTFNLIFRQPKVPYGNVPTVMTGNDCDWVRKRIEGAGRPNRSSLLRARSHMELDWKNFFHRWHPSLCISIGLIQF